MSPWDDPRNVARLKRLAAQGDKSFAQIAATMGLGRMQVGNKLRRLRLGKAADAGVRAPRDFSTPVKNSWSESALTERWADRRRV